MTRAGLEKEATQYALEWGSKTDGTYACCRDGYLAGAEPREKRIEELEAQIKKMLHTFVDLLWFENNLDPYVYECDGAQKGELLKPFSEARDCLKQYKCKKCGGTGVVRDGYKGWHESPCSTCEGKGYILGDKRK